MAMIVSTATTTMPERNQIRKPPAKRRRRRLSPTPSPAAMRSVGCSPAWLSTRVAAGVAPAHSAAAAISSPALA